MYNSEHAFTQRYVYLGQHGVIAGDYCKIPMVLSLPSIDKIQSQIMGKKEERGSSMNPKGLVYNIVLHYLEKKIWMRIRFEGKEIMSLILDVDFDAAIKHPSKEVWLRLIYWSRAQSNSLAWKHTFQSFNKLVMTKAMKVGELA